MSSTLNAPLEDWSYSLSFKKHAVVNETKFFITAPLSWSERIFCENIAQWLNIAHSAGSFPRKLRLKAFLYCYSHRSLDLWRYITWQENMMGGRNRTKKFKSCSIQSMPPNRKLRGKLNYLRDININQEHSWNQR